MKAALLGTPGSGRKTLMTALNGGQSGTISAGRRNISTIRVPDPRIDWLAEVFRPKKTTWATLELLFDDTPFESMGKRLNSARSAEVLVIVTSAFGLGEDSAEVALEEADNFLDDMLLADQIIVDKRLELLKKLGEKGQERKLFERLSAMLEEGRHLGGVPFIDAELNLMKPYSFLTEKPVIVVLNVDEAELENPMWSDVHERIRKRGSLPLTLCAALEAEVATLDPSEQIEFLEAVGLSLPASHRLVQSVYSALNLISFFTVGEDEVRAWPVRKGAFAPEAAGRIHSDLQRGFIRAEVVSYAHFQQVGSLAAARRTGRYRSEGKNYPIVDGDIINFLFNV
jgi:ribosome-binding ATPase